MTKTDDRTAGELEISTGPDQSGFRVPERPGLWRRYRALPRNVIAIGLVSLLNDASSEIIYPLLPFFLAITLGASPTIIGIIEGAAESISGILKLFSGYFSDRRGRRKGLVVFGYALTSVVRPLLAFAGNWVQVLAIRITDRVGKGLRSAPRDSMIADAVPLKNRGLAFGFDRAMDHAGAVAGPLLSYLALLWIAGNRNNPTASDYAKIFLLASVPALGAVLVAAFVVREKKPSTAVRATSTELAPVHFSLRGFDANFKRFLFIIGLFTLSNSSDAFLLLRAAPAGVATATLLWAGLHVTKVLSSLIGGDFSDRLGRKRLIVSGWLLYACIYAGFAFVTPVSATWALFLIYGIYFGLSEGAEKALVADLVSTGRRGTAYGLYNLAISITVFPASLLLGALWAWRGPTIAFLISSGISLVAAGLLSIAVRAPGASGLPQTQGT